MTDDNRAQDITAGTCLTDFIPASVISNLKAKYPDNSVKVAWNLRNWLNSHGIRCGLVEFEDNIEARGLHFIRGKDGMEQVFIRGQHYAIVVLAGCTCAIDALASRTVLDIQACTANVVSGMGNPIVSATDALLGPDDVEYYARYDTEDGFVLDEIPDWLMEPISLEELDANDWEVPLDEE